MATKKLTQSIIKQMVKSGAAIDLETMKKRPRPSQLELIGLSFGINGMNGGLFIGKNKKMYAITSRSSLLFEYA